MTGRYPFIALLLLLLTPSVLAQPAPDGRTSPTVRVLTASPATGIHVDGVLDEADWQNADVATDFVQFEPTEGAAPSQRTEVRVLYGGDAIYVGATLFDSEPDQIRRTLTRRDRTGDSDGFVIGFDSYDDKKTAYLFGLTAAGVQFDAILTSNGDDDSWDAVWSSDVQITPDGWVAELRIPLSQLRFSEGATAWGFQVQRQIRRSGEEIFWAPFTHEEANSGIVQYFGRLEGLPGLQPRRTIQATPYTLAQANTFEDEVLPGTMDADYGYDVGADFKVGIASNITLDATVNPDFGQVESDPAQLNLSTFETFFSERRPFFLEGTQIFDYTIGSGDGSLLYTRRIGGAAPIIGATKVSGRLPSGLSFGVLGAATGDDFDPNRWYGTARLKQEFGSQNYVGGAITGFSSPFEAGSGIRSFTGGIDWDTRLGRDDVMKLEGSLAGSLRDNLDPDGTDPSQRGYALYVGFDKVKGFFTPGSGLRIYSDDFQINDIGRFRQNDLISARLGTGYLFNEGNPVGPFRRLNSFAGATQVWRYSDGTNRGLGFFAGMFGDLLGFQELFVNVNGNGFGGFDVRETRGLGVIENAPEVFVNLSYETDQRKLVVADLSIGAGFGGDGGRSASVGGDIDWTVSDRVSLSLEGGISGTDNWRAWAANEGFIRSQDGLFLGNDADTPDTFGPDDLFGLDLDAAGIDALLGGIEPGEDVLQIPDAAGFYLPIFGRRDVRQAAISSRANVIFSPNLSLQFYGQLFAARGRYDDFQLLAAPDDLRNFDYPRRRDFSFESFQANAVLRWEYRPGSTLFVVWTQARNGGIDEALLLDGPVPPSPFDVGTGTQLRDVFGIYPENVFLLKLNYLLMR